MSTPTETAATTAEPVRKKEGASKPTKKKAKKPVSSNGKPTKKKKAAKAKPTKKATKPLKGAAKKKKAESNSGPSRRLQAFRLLAKKPSGLTMNQLKEKMGATRGLPFMKDEALARNPRVKYEQHEEVRGVLYVLTAAGNNAIKDGTVDDKAPAATKGQSKLRGQ